MDTKLLKELRVVYVEDDNDTREHTAKALGDFFWEFVSCKNASEALLVDGRIDVLISDIRMPQISGLELVEKLRAKKSPACIIFTTAHDDSEYLLKAISLKVDEYILKPVDLADLLDRIESNIVGQRQSMELAKSNKILEALSVFVGGKKIEIIKYLIDNADSAGNYFGTYEDIMTGIDVSKPTVVATFKQLSDAGLVKKVKNKNYKLTVF